MSDRSAIEWTDATWNPVRGCTRVSEGCTRCYAEAVAARFSGPGLPYEGLARSTPGGPRWTGEVRLIEKHLEDPLRWKEPRRIFVNSMSDLFHEKLTDQTIDRIFAVMARCPQHTFQILTKRPERMRAYLSLERQLAIADAWTAQVVGRSPGPTDLRFTVDKWPLPNVWLGVSVENQAAANERVPLLLETPAAVRFLSCEPLLGPVNLGETLSLDWVICGGESGPRARPMHPDWARGLRNQCVDAGVPFFFKQWGEWEPVRDLYQGDEDLDDGRGELLALDVDGYLHDGTGPVYQPAAHAWLMERVGKKRAGALLDGREWREFPR